MTREAQLDSKWAHSPGWQGKPMIAITVTTIETMMKTLALLSLIINLPTENKAISKFSKLNWKFLFRKINKFFDWGRWFSRSFACTSSSARKCMWCGCWQNQWANSFVTNSYRQIHQWDVGWKLSTIHKRIVAAHLMPNELSFAQVNCQRRTNSQMSKTMNRLCFSNVKRIKEH